MPARHNLTCYICGPHYAQLMGPLGAKQVGMEAVRPPVGEEVVLRVRDAIRRVKEERHAPITGDEELEARAAILAMQSNG
jgi:hypothetical protein